jgi:6-pyruvoyltetrahydropterin/6-carboxytetrahydropterin synthase
MTSNTLKSKFKYGIKVNKDYLKFSAAHFLIFDAQNAERLHGHNYYVNFEAGLNSNLDDKGFILDFKEVKQVLREVCDQLDERVLLPDLHPEIRKTTVKDHLQIKFRNRTYMFPVDEVVMLPMINTSCECLSQYLLQQLLEHIKGLSFLKIEVQETSGQSAYAIFSDPKS